LTRLKKYRGRFAPTPSGPLHFGSIVTALGSYLDAKSNDGKWFIRIDDIDNSRNKLNADKVILDQLCQLGLNWDEPILYQSQHLELYEVALNKLVEAGRAYPCTCTRQKVKNQIYPGTCRNENSLNKKHSIRVKTDNSQISIIDRLQGVYSQKIDIEVGDFIIKRSDGYFAYHLATTVDDNEQAITHVVRGFDLLDSTPRQIFLQNKLQYSEVQYLHLPIVINSTGRKISKADKESTSEMPSPGIVLVNALEFLGHCPPDKMKNANIKTILDWAIKNWNLDLLPKKAKINYSI